jgi:hypothetical protein
MQKLVKSQALPIAERLMEALPSDTPGHYDEATQTWSHRDAATLSPVKHNREH